MNPLAGNDFLIWVWHLSIIIIKSCLLVIINIYWWDCDYVHELKIAEKGFEVCIEKALWQSLILGMVAEFIPEIIHWRKRKTLLNKQNENETMCANMQMHAHGDFSEKKTHKINWHGGVLAVCMVTWIPSAHFSRAQLCKFVATLHCFNQSVSLSLAHVHRNW